MSAFSTEESRKSPENSSDLTAVVACIFIPLGMIFPEEQAGVRY
jgi:hypothetical protein